MLPYQDASLSAEARVADLLARMTLAEKSAQMKCAWQEKATKLVDAAGNFDIEKARVAFKDGHGLGQVGRPSDAGSDPASVASIPDRPAGPTVKLKIQTRARELGFDDCRVTTTAAPDHAGEFTDWLDRDRHGEMAWLERNAPKRIDPRQVLAGARSMS